MAKIQKGKDVRVYPRTKIQWEFPERKKNKMILDLLDALQGIQRKESNSIFSPASF